MILRVLGVFAGIVSPLRVWNSKFRRTSSRLPGYLISMCEDHIEIPAIPGIPARWRGRGWLGLGLKGARRQPSNSMTELLAITAPAHFAVKTDFAISIPIVLTSPMDGYLQCGAFRRNNPMALQCRRAGAVHHIIRVITPSRHVRFASRADIRQGAVASRRLRVGRGATRTTAGRHPGWRGAPVTTTRLSSMRISRSISPLSSAICCSRWARGHGVFAI